MYKSMIVSLNNILDRLQINKRSEMIGAALYYSDMGRSELSIYYHNYFNKKAPKNYTGDTVTIKGIRYKYYKSIAECILDYKPVKKDTNTIRKYILKYKLYNFDR